MATAHNGTCEIHYETFGDRSNPALLLVNGLGSQCINYHEDWCAMFVGAGRYVIRFDNRDVGFSSSFTDAPTDSRGAAYSIGDMARDAVAVLDAEGIDRAHAMGLSMGGMVVQVLAIEHPTRLRSATSVMSTTGEPEYGQSKPEALALLAGPAATDRESFIANHIAGARAWGSPAFADEHRWRRDAERAYDRAFTPSGTTRQLIAIQASGSRAEALRSVMVPMLVIHGDCDTLIDESGGRRTAELVPGARFELIEGMGHDYPPQLWRRWVDLVAGFTGAVDAAS
ncbi:MAG: alpha/beta hydrolase [Actinomycetota bacterium]